MRPLKHSRCGIVFTTNPCLCSRFAKKNDLPNLEYCTLPRTGALEIALEVLGPAQSQQQKIENNGSSNGAVVVTPSPTADRAADSERITKIVDVTIAYPEGKPLDLQSIVLGWRKPCVTHVHYRVFDVKDVRITYNVRSHRVLVIMECVFPQKKNPVRSFRASFGLAGMLGYFTKA